MSQSIFDTWAPQLESLLAYARGRPFLTTIAIGVIPLLAHAIPSYRGFVAIGPSGIPNNIFGWLMQAVAQPISHRDVTSLEPYRNPKTVEQFGPHGRKNFLGDSPLPQRQGDRPEVPTYVAPQRQTTEKGSAAEITRMDAFLADLARQNHGLLAVRNSGLEHKDSKALWLDIDVVSPPRYLAKATKGELVHVHPEGSTHAVLNLADAEAAIRMGWAQRHMLSGVIIPVSYVLIYAPRDEYEFQVWKRFAGAAVGFAAAEIGKVANVQSL